jgi:hypothetical protein
MDILLVASAFNSLSQRVYAELSDRGHRVDVVLASHGTDAVLAAVREARPELIVAPMLRTALPEEVWREHTCLIVHPGPPGDRGPSSLDWAIAEGAARWGVTVLQAEAGMDAGDVWAAVSFPVPPVGKSDLYRGEVADAASAAVLLAVQRYTDGAFKPRPQSDPGIRVVWRDFFRQEQRGIDWENDGTETVLGSSARPTRSRGSSTKSSAARCSCTAGTPRTGSVALPANCWRPGPARSAGPPATARCGSWSCAPARVPATRRRSAAPPRRSSRASPPRPAPTGGRPAATSARTGCR